LAIDLLRTCKAVLVAASHTRTVFCAAQSACLRSVRRTGPLLTSACFTRTWPTTTTRPMRWHAVRALRSRTDQRLARSPIASHSRRKHSRLSVRTCPRTSCAVRKAARRAMRESLTLSGVSARVRTCVRACVRRLGTARDRGPLPGGRPRRANSLAVHIAAGAVAPPAPGLSHDRAFAAHKEPVKSRRRNSI
jgi:hypothetical protein